MVRVRLAPRTSTKELAMRLGAAVRTAPLLLPLFARAWTN